MPASKPAPEEPIQLKKEVPQPEKESLEPSELNKMLGQEAWILGGIVSENRIMEDGSIIAKILIRKELQHWATESTKENSEDMDDYTGDHKAYYILALMTKTGEFLQFGGEHTDKIEAFKVDEWYPLMSDEKEFRSVSAMEENDIRKQA